MGLPAWALNKVAVHSSHSCVHFKVVPLIKVACCSIYLHIFDLIILFQDDFVCVGAKQIDLASKPDYMIFVFTILVIDITIAFLLE